MKKVHIFWMVAIFLFSISGVVSAGTVDIQPWSYPNGYTEGLSLSLPSDAEQFNYYVKISGCKGKKNCPTSNLIRQDKRIEIVFNQEGDYVVYASYWGREKLTENISRNIGLQYEFPIKVGKIYFMPRNRWDDVNGTIYQTFLVMPQFGYTMPQHIDAEISLGDIKRSVSFNCLTMQSYGYCETSPIELTGDEYNQVIGDTYTCFKTADTESCHIARYTW